MRYIGFRTIFVLMLYVLSLIALPAQAQTQASGNGDSWKYIGKIYLWGAGIKGTTQGGGDIDVSFSDILDSLDFALMGGLEARKSKLSLVADFLHLNLGQNGGASLPVSGVPVNTNLDIKGNVVNLLAGYNLSNTPKALTDVFVGARYLDLDTTITASLPGRPGSSFSDSGSVWDGVVGIRGELNLNESWYIPYYVDVGTGASDLTWQALAGIGYKLTRWDLTLAYRHIEWEFESDRRINDINFSGPGFLAKFHF